MASNWFNINYSNKDQVGSWSLKNSLVEGRVGNKPHLVRARMNLGPIVPHPPLALIPFCNSWRECSSRTDGFGVEESELANRFHCNQVPLSTSCCRIETLRQGKCWDFIERLLHTNSLSLHWEALGSCQLWENARHGRPNSDEQKNSINSSLISNALYQCLK